MEPAAAWRPEGREDTMRGSESGFQEFAAGIQGQNGLDSIKQRIDQRGRAHATAQNPGWPLVKFDEYPLAGARRHDADRIGITLMTPPAQNFIARAGASRLHASSVSQFTHDTCPQSHSSEPA